MDDLNSSWLLFTAGLRVLVTHIERAAANIKILQLFVQTAASGFPSQSRSVKAVHPDFRLFMSTCLPVPAVINGETI